ncbi:SAR2788 family putative toxin [Cytobacillus horneckiae]|uniref:MafB-like protein n=1 Tax=Cytobacillus horneckiae TaxID=549687 RepID=A0A2N0ZI46_9BACI|nr:SAR2788 family putative toxin [Cytobacillus horneckiae]MEC1158000.1 SAR2788 family putative toxin [Cytobacillus horneckiae]MED2937075.1 SAR2788 family putative toxin [Cytobacillus horneckiae]PKG29173.1 hypothetical protein CWS20_10460 [Cytobacillus horneckiae]
MKRFFVNFLIVVYLFSCFAPSFVQAQDSSVDSEENLIDFAEIEEQIDDDLAMNELDDVIETVSYVGDDTDSLIVLSSAETEGIEAENEMSIDIENQEIITSTTVEDEETGELIEYNFDIEVTDINGEEFKAIFTDLDTGEQLYVDTAEFQASWYPLIVVAIHVAIHGVKWAVKKYGKSVVNNATKKYGTKASGKTLSKIKFASNAKFDSHWADHKKEFPGLTKTGYLKRAQSLAGSTSKNVLSKKKKGNSGDIVKYNTQTGEFISLTKNDVIKTFFKPKYGQKDWKKKARAYYNNQ